MKENNVRPTQNLMLENALIRIYSIHICIKFVLGSHGFIHIDFTIHYANPDGI